VSSDYHPSSRRRRRAGLQRKAGAACRAIYTTKRAMVRHPERPAGVRPDDRPPGGDRAPAAADCGASLATVTRLYPPDAGWLICDARPFPGRIAERLPPCRYSASVSTDTSTVRGSTTGVAGAQVKWTATGAAGSSP